MQQPWPITLHSTITSQEQTLAQSSIFKLQTHLFMLELTLLSELEFIIMGVLPMSLNSQII